MADEPQGGHDDGDPDGGGPEIVELSSVPGFVVFDLPGVELSAGGTRLAPDVSVAEVALLARAMTYKYAAIGAQIGGAKAGVRGDPADLAGKAELMARFCAEVSPLFEAGRFMTGPDMGTREEDFAPLRQYRAVPAGMGSVVGGLPFEDVVTGYGVAAAADAALSAEWGWGWDGRSVAIEGFGKVGGGVAREVARRGGRVVAVSTVAGCVSDPSGLDVELLLALRRVHGDACVTHYGRPVGPPGRLFTAVKADVGNPNMWFSAGAADAILRVLTGEQPIEDPGVKFRTFTADNIAGLDTSKEDPMNWYNIDPKTEYRKLWGLGS